MDAINNSDNFDSHDTGNVKRHRSKNKKYNSMRKDEREDKLVLNGTVAEALPGTWFNIKLNSGDVTVLATLSGKMRQNHIQILPGDKVIIEVSPYDTSRGRICRRL